MKEFNQRKFLNLIEAIESPDNPTPEIYRELRALKTWNQNPNNIFQEVSRRYRESLLDYSRIRDQRYVPFPGFTNLVRQKISDGNRVIADILRSKDVKRLLQDHQAQVIVVGSQATGRVKNHDLDLIIASTTKPTWREIDRVLTFDLIEKWSQISSSEPHFSWTTIRDILDKIANPRNHHGLLIELDIGYLAAINNGLTAMDFSQGLISSKAQAILQGEPEACLIAAAILKDQTPPSHQGD